MKQNLIDKGMGEHTYIKVKSSTGAGKWFTVLRASDVADRPHYSTLTFS